MSQHMIAYSAHTDTFARDNLPPADQWPTFIFNDPVLDYPERLNCAGELLDRHVEDGHGDRVVIRTPDITWTYAELQDKANRIAAILVSDFGLVPGNRVLLRGFNSPMMVAAWFGVVKAGGIVVATMPMLRAMEIAKVIDKAQIGLVLCDTRLSEDMEKAATLTPHCRRICYFDGTGRDMFETELERRMTDKPGAFANVETSRDDTVLIAFTSGTTGQPKGCMHFHRDVLAICDTYARTLVKPSPEDVFAGSPPIAFTFGLGGLVTFPMRFGASTVLLEKAGPVELMQAVERFGITVTFTAPTAYRRMVDLVSETNVSSLRMCVSAGETLPAPTWHAWYDATGIRIAEGIGSTELLHIFISAAGLDVRPGATGKVVPGYEARVVDQNMRPVAVGEVGLLAVRGPTGCRYLADSRQRDYVKGGWNMTGDAYLLDEDGYFIYQARADDMIVTSGYKVAGPEVEAVLLNHPAVAECAVIGSPDPERGHAIKAFVVLRDGAGESVELVDTLKAYVKDSISRYKCPHDIVFTDALPKTETGKVQRFRLREMEDLQRSPAAAE